MASQNFRDFFLQGNFITRSNLVELAFGAVVVVGLGTVFDSLTSNVLAPLIGTIGIPDLTVLKPYGIGIGSFLNTVLAFVIKTASLYFLVVFPLNRLVLKHSSRQ